MEWLTEIFIEQSYTQAILIISLICAVGLALGKVKIAGVSLGISFVFFAGIIAGHFGIKINSDMLLLAQNFGLIIYIYSLGLQVGPGFFSSFKHGGIKLNLLALLLLLVGSLTAIILFWTTDLSVSDTVGLLSGAVTNTPMLGAGQQALMQVDPENIEGANRMAMACAVAYPFGLIGLIITVILLRKILAPKNASPAHNPSADNTFIAEYQISNPAIFGKSIMEVRQNAECPFVISRVWKAGKLIIPTSETILEKDEHILVISGKKDVERIRTIFGHQENIDWNKKDIDWNAIDSQLVSSKVLVTKPEHNGVKLGDMRLRNSYGINITRVNRAGIDLLPSRNLRLQLGDKLTVACSNLLGGKTHKATCRRFYEIGKHPTCDGRVKHHKQNIARKCHVTVNMPLCALGLKLTVKKHGALLSRAAHGEFHDHNGKTQQQQAQRVDQHEAAATILSSHPGELPHVAAANGAACTQQDESQTGSQTFAIFHNFLFLSLL